MSRANEDFNVQSFAVDGLPIDSIKDRLSSFSNFELLPAAAVAAATDKFFVSSGTGVTTTTRAAKGGVSFSVPDALNNSTVLAGEANTPFRPVLSATNKVRVRSRIMLADVTAAKIFTLALSTTFSGTNPIPSASGNNSCGFLADPANQLATGLTAAQLLNWVIWTKDGAGAVVFRATNVPLVANRDYVLGIDIDSALKPVFKINGLLISLSTAAPALAAGTVVLNMGLKDNAAAAGGANVFECRYCKASALMA